MPIVVDDTGGTGATFLEMQNAVLEERFDSSTYRQRVKGWLNDAFGRIARRADIPRLRILDSIPTVPGENTADLPSDFARSVRLFFADRSFGPLEEVEDVEIDSLGDQSGRPLYYAVTGGQLYFWPTPDDTYDLSFRYQRLPARLVNDGDIPELPEDYRDLAVTFATSRGYRSEDDKSQANEWMADFEADLSRLKVDLREDSLDGPIVVEGTFGADTTPLW